MTKISSGATSWTTQMYEAVRGPSPIGFFNRICVADRTCFFDRIWSVETSKNALKDKILVCREKAGVRGSKYPEEVEHWKGEVISLSQGVRADEAPGLSLPTEASSKNELVYNHELAKAATDQELDTLSRNVSAYVTLLLIHNQFGPDVDSTVIFDLIARNKNNPQKDVLNLYLEHFSPQMTGANGVIMRNALRFGYYFYSGIIAGVISTTFQNMLAEIRHTTDGKSERIFQVLVDNLEKFLKDYRGEKPLEDFIEQKDMPALCKELSPHLVEEFFPKKIEFFKIMFKRIPLSSIPAYILDSTVGVIFNVLVRVALRFSLPGILEQLSESVEASVVAQLTETETEPKEAPINYQIAIPVMRFVNDKLFEFCELLKEPPLDVSEPPPPQLAAKLEGLIDELLKLSVNPSNDAMVKEGMRVGLIDGVYRLMQFFESEQETLLQQLLMLASLPYSEIQEPSDIEADKKEYEMLWSQQGKLAETLTDRIFTLETKKIAAGSPGKQVQYLLTKEHAKIKRYLQEGLSDFIGLKSALKVAEKELNRSEYASFDTVLKKHLVFWEGFISMIKDGSKQHNPAPVKEILEREFYPLCQEGQAQIQTVSGLQDQWVLYNRHKELKANFQELASLMQFKTIHTLNITQIQRLLNKIEVLLPANAVEVQVIKRFIESFSTFKALEVYIYDLSEMKDVLRQQKQGPLKKSHFEEFNRVLLRYPHLQSDPKFTQLLRTYKSLCNGEKLTGPTKPHTVLVEMMRRIDRELHGHSQRVKDLQINLLHRIYPTRQSSSFAVPCSMHSLVKEVGQWVMFKSNGYGVLEKDNRANLKAGILELETQVNRIAKKVDQMTPHKLYFPVESFIDGMGWVCGDITNIPGIYTIKKHLQQDLTGILEGLTPLLAAKKEEGKRNLYSWVEKLALFETLKHFKAKRS